jgi:hypothetical protein
VKGIIDINNENHLVKSRLIGNLLKPTRKDNFSFRKLTDNLEAVSLKLKLNESKRGTILYEIKNESGKTTEEVKITNLNFNIENFLKKLSKRFKFHYSPYNKNNSQYALDYIVYKAVSIAIKYDNYIGYFNKTEKNFLKESIDEFINELYNDQSHITFKLRQIINLLKHQHIELKDQIIDLNLLSETINNIKTGNKKREIIEFIPPPIFTVDILLKPNNGLENYIELRKLSSGEKQMIYSVSSLLYHLTNIESIRNSKKRTAYRFVNIILEEVELHFHPEMQRTYINYILESVRRLELRRIHSVNFCFVTHSPFILSDIPDSNILFLGNNGKPLKANDQVKTFGGNVHELLAHSFFLNNGFVGEFAKNKIQSIINALSNDSSQDISNIEKETIFKGIQIIGEPFLKDKLMEMYYSKFETQKRIAELEAQLAQLRNNG